MTSKPESRQGSSSSHPVITIKHGKDPEVQEVDISTRIIHDVTIPGAVDDLRLMKKRSKSMTTKSTMTNEDDYTVVHTNTPCTTPTSSIRPDDVADDETQDVIEVGHKMVGWKMTPRVHFPPPNTINASSSLRTAEGRSRNLSKSENITFTSRIDPPYVHRPDRTLVVHQTKPIPLQPVKAWPGYGGNVYFQPFKVGSKPIGDRSANKSPVTRSRSCTGIRYEKSTTGTDVFSLSKLSSVPQSSPNTNSIRKMNSPFYKDDDENDYDDPGNRGYDRKLESRQMAYLDKNYVLGLRKNCALTEDWSWITGMESLGTLKIGNPLTDVKRQSTNETFTRHTIVEKVPRNFVFHPITSDVESKEILKNHINEKVNSFSVREYLKSYGIPDWTIKQFVEKYYRDDKGRLRLPVIPLRVKGRKAHICGNTDLLFNSFRLKPTKAKTPNMKLHRHHHLQPIVGEAGLLQADFRSKVDSEAGSKLLDRHNHNPRESTEVEQETETNRFSNLNDLLIQHYANKNSDNRVTNNSI